MTSKLQGVGEETPPTTDMKLLDDWGYVDEIENKLYNKPLWREVALRPNGEHKGSLYDEDLDWDIDEYNTHWHDRFFTTQTVKDHQAKANCCLVNKVVKRMEERGYINKENTVVLDPMAGAASMLVVAGLLGYTGVGIELEKRYVKNLIGYDEPDYSDDTLFGLKGHIEGTVEKYLRMTAVMPKAGIIYIRQGDARVTHTLINDETPARHGKRIAIISSPPYGRVSEHDEKKANSVDGAVKVHKYDHPDNIATLMDNAYSREMLKVYKSYAAVSRLEYVALFTRDFIQKGKIVYLSTLTVELMDKAGFDLIDIWRARLKAVSLFKKINYAKFHEEKGLPLIDWEEVTIYKKRR